jgi:hypothetical protein
MTPRQIIKGASFVFDLVFCLDFFSCLTMQGPCKEEGGWVLTLEVGVVEVEAAEVAGDEEEEVARV